MNGTNRKLKVLLVEDNSGDARLVQEAFRDASIPTSLTVVRDGVEALELLSRDEGEQRLPAPDIILLDLEMPRANGFDVLKEVKSDERLKYIPVIVLTGSGSEENVQRCYDLNANCFIEKKAEWQQFIAAVKLIQEFWCGLVTLPPQPDSQEQSRA